jgi:hypothetical protein
MTQLLYRHDANIRKGNAAYCSKPYDELCQVATHDSVANEPELWEHPSHPTGKSRGNRAPRSPRRPTRCPG